MYNKAWGSHGPAVRPDGRGGARGWSMLLPLLMWYSPPSALKRTSYNQPLTAVWLSWSSAHHCSLCALLHSPLLFINVFVNFCLHICVYTCKPPNMMLVNHETELLRLKLINFGLTCKATKAFPGYVLWTLPYRSVPETPLTFDRCLQ